MRSMYHFDYMIKRKKKDLIIDEINLEWYKLEWYIT